MSIDFNTKVVNFVVNKMSTLESKTPQNQEKYSSPTGLQKC